VQETQYSFGPFKLYPTEHLLVRDTTPILLAPKAYELLVALVSQHGRLVTRAELMKAIWPDSYVEEINLTVNISLLRKTLGQQPDGRPYITTVPKCGYRFDADVVQNGAGRSNGVTPVEVVPVAEESEEEEKQPAIIVPDSPIGEPAPPRPVRSHALGSNRAWTAISLVTVVAACALLIYLWRSHAQLGTAAGHPPIRSLAILPFNSLGSDKDAEYLGLGMTDALITRLNGLHQVVVRPIEAVRGLQGNPDPLVEARKLGVEAVLDGTIQKIGNTTRVTAPRTATFWPAKASTSKTPTPSSWKTPSPRNSPRTWLSTSLPKKRSVSASSGRGTVRPTTSIPGAAIT
jgi:DNA-binding winged helix-turn-helix (wHTH) protein